jgi:D-alanyl-D-alanine carboxypeptidase
MKNSMNITIILFYIAVVTMMTGCATTSKDNTVYRGSPKHTQPSLAVLPSPNSYNLNQELDASTQRKLNQKIDELFDKHNIAGISATVLIPEKGIWETNRGFISKPDDIVVDNATLFFWASVAKLITSTVVHQLIVENKLSFNDKLSHWFPDIQYAEEITIEQLLTHTNGIYSFNFDPAFQDMHEIYTADEFIAIATAISKSHENLFKPGEYWSYTNTGYLLLSLIIEEIESKTLAKVVQERIAKPLHLKSLRIASKNEPHLALAHNKGAVIREDYSILSGVGGIVSNSKDMATFLSALLTGKIIPVKDVHSMMKNLYPMFDKGQYYGRGIMLYDFNKINQTNKVWIGHSGGIENYRAILLYDTQSKSIMAISINDNTPVEAVAYKLIEVIE